MVAVKGTSTTEIHVYSLCGNQDITGEMAAISGEVLKIATPDVLYQSGLLYKECTNSITL